MRDPRRVLRLDSVGYRFSALSWFSLFSAAFTQLGASPWEVPAPGSCINTTPLAAEGTAAAGETAHPASSRRQHPNRILRATRV